MEISLENRDNIISSLKEGTCPICGKAGFENPLSHIARTHGMPANELKDALLISQGETFASPELSASRSATAIKNYHPGKLCPPNKGNKHGDKTKEKIAIASKETYKANANFHEAYKRNASNARLAAHKARSKSVIRISADGEAETYKSIREAARDNNVHCSTIARCLKKKNSSCAGFRWKYAD